MRWQSHPVEKKRRSCLRQFFATYIYVWQDHLAQNTRACISLNPATPRATAVRVFG